MLYDILGPLRENLPRTTPYPVCAVISKTAGYCWRTLKSWKFYPIYNFFKHKEQGKSHTDRSALSIETGSPTVSRRS
jgi:hypothetical protein